MDVIKWDSQFTIGIPKFDDKHKDLFFHLENYRLAVNHGQPGTQIIRSLFDHAQNYAHLYLAYEEAVFRQINHVQLDTLIKDHRYFATETHRFKQLYYDLPSLFPHKNLLAFLYDWLVNHITNMDWQCIRHVQQHTFHDNLGHDNLGHDNLGIITHAPLVSSLGRTPGQRPLLVVLDDEHSIGNIVCSVAENLGFEAHAFQHPHQFYTHYSEHIDVIVLDIHMPQMDGIEVIRDLAERHCQAAFILISGFDNSVLHSAQELAIEQRLDFKGALTKPFRISKLRQILTPLIEKQPRAPKVQALTGKPFSAAEISAALSSRQFVAHFQPQIALTDKAVVGLEILCRWYHPEKGLILPAEFIPLAEKFDLITPITWFILTQAIVQTKPWREQNPEMQLSINMSASMFSTLDLPEKMSALMQQYDMSPNNLVIEVTESIIMDEQVKALDSLTRLRLKGFKISIDDFGTGYSSMMQLHRIPFSEIKIDQSFILKMQHDPEAQAIAETVIMLGHKLGLTVVAEGIEDNATLSQLKVLNCEVGQGYHFARPMNAEHLHHWLQQDKKIKQPDTRLHTHYALSDTADE